MADFWRLALFERSRGRTRGKRLAALYGSLKRIQRRTMASKQRRINKHVSWNRCFQRVEKGKQIRTKRSPYGSTGPIKTILYASVKVPVHSHNQTATAHTLDNQRYTRTAFALCLNDVISCLYLPFITAVSFPPAAPPRERYPGSR